MAATLFEMVGRVRQVKANCPGEQAEGFVNRRIRNIVDKRTWADTLKLSAVLLPDAILSGTITLTLGSNQITGVGTGWPVADLINTALANQPIVDIGYVDNVTPASMQNITVGQWVIIEAERPDNMEITQVVAVGPNTFTAFIRNQHDASVSVTASSIAGRQINSNNYVYTIQAVLDPQTIVIDRPWGSATTSGQQYLIIQAYCTITPNTKRILFCYDPVAGSWVGTDKTWDFLAMEDPQRSSTGDPAEMVSMPPDPAGIMRWEVWPWQVTARALNVVTVERWPKLNYDTDLSPYFINPEVIIAGACADALRTKVLQRGERGDPYYDPTAAQYWDGEYMRLLEEAEQETEGRYLRSLQDYRMQAMGQTNLLAGNWARSHAVPSWAGWPWGGTDGW